MFNNLNKLIIFSIIQLYICKKNLVRVKAKKYIILKLNKSTKTILI